MASTHVYIWNEGVTIVQLHRQASVVYPVTVAASGARALYEYEHIRELVRVHVSAFLTRCVPTFNYWAPHRQWVFTHSVASTVACDAIQIGCPHFFNGGLHVDFGVVQWSRIVEVQKTKRYESNPQLNVGTSLEDSYNSPQAVTAREIEPH